MSTPIDDDDAPDALTREYRRAHADDQLRPAAATRAAILAEARRVAAQVTPSARPVPPLPPAANDTWWNWKAAASIAVMALAGVLSWRVFRTEPLLQQAPASAPASATLESPASAARAAAEPPAALAKSAAPAAIPPPAVSRPALQRPEAEADAARTVARAEAPAAPAVAPKLAVAPATESVAAPQASMRQAVAGNIASDAATGGAMADSSPLALMERYFPQAFGRPPGQSRPWILFDAQGAVLQSGERPWQGMEELRGFLQQRSPAISIARSSTGTVSNSRGQAVDYAFFWVAAAR